MYKHITLQENQINCETFLKITVSDIEHNMYDTIQLSLSSLTKIILIYTNIVNLGAQLNT